MKINGINSQNIINTYNRINDTKVNAINENTKKDSIEISSIGKSLMNYSLENLNINLDKDIELIKNKINNGTYNVDARLTAQSMIDYIRGNKI